MASQQQQQQQLHHHLDAHTVATELVTFLNASPTPFHAVYEAKSLLKTAGFLPLSERDDWHLLPGGKYFFTRNHSTIVAFAVGKNYVPGNGFMIVGAHTDSPCPKLKPVSKLTNGGFLEVGVQPYGGGLWHTWFDRDLTIAGRVMVQRESEGVTSFSHELVRIQEPIIRIPTLAIHLDRNVNNDGFQVNTQSHLVPVLATAIKAEVNKHTGNVAFCSPAEENDINATYNVHTEANKIKGKSGLESVDAIHHPLLLELVSREIGCHPKEVCDFELQVCDMQPSIIGGALKEFIFSGRLDNLCMSFCSLKALIDATSEDSLEHENGVRMVALFDHEEVGSNSAQGAGSPVMFDALTRITLSFASNGSQVLVDKAVQKSLLVSADMAHCLHPNYMDKHDANHQPKMHKGLVIKHNANQRYATNAVTAFLFRQIGKKHNIPVQDFVVRNDMACGSTIGPILASGVGIRTVDVGAPQLSMHSIREMCGVDDVGYSYQHFKAFYQEFSTFASQEVVDC